MVPMRSWPFSLALLLALFAPTLAGAQQRGVPLSGFPNWQERMIQVYVNRARADPSADLAGCTVCAEKSCYTPKPPAVYSYNLNRAARFHSALLSKTNK